MGISVLIPTRSRPKRFLNARDSALKHAKGEVEFLSYVDEDDPLRKEYPEPTIVGPRIFSAHAIHKLLPLAKHEFIMLGSDDVEFCSDGWDDLLTKDFPADRIALSHGHDGWKGSAGHCLVFSKRWYEATGLFPNVFTHFGPDTYIGTVAVRLERFLHYPDVLIKHLHFRNHKVEKDQTYTDVRVGSVIEVDTRKLNTLEESIKKDVAILRELIERSSQSSGAVQAA